MDNQPPVGIDHPRLTVLADLHRDRVPELLEADLGHADAGILPLAGEREPHVGLGLAAEIDRPVMDPVHGEFVISRSNGGCVQSCELPTSLMIHLLILAVHLLATIAKLVRPGGVRAVVAESLVLKQQLLISSRARRRAPNLNSFDRFLLGLGSLFVPASRIPKLAVILKPRTLLRFHEALKKRKYRWLFSTGGHRRPGPKGHRTNSSTRTSSSSAAIPVLAVPASHSRLRVPLASISTKTLSVGYSRNRPGRKQAPKESRPLDRYRRGRRRSGSSIQ